MTEVRDNPEKSRYELLEDGKLLGVADYRSMGDTLAFPHTEIVPARRKQGLGEQLVKGALDDVDPDDIEAEVAELLGEDHPLAAPPEDDAEH